MWLLLLIVFIRPAFLAVNPVCTMPFFSSCKKFGTIAEENYKAYKSATQRQLHSSTSPWPIILCFYLPVYNPVNWIIRVFFCQAASGQDWR